MSNTTENLSAMDALSLDISRHQIGGHICFILIGLLAAIGNTLVVLTIWKSDTLHNKCMITLASLATCDLLSGIAFTIVGTKKLYLILHEIPESSPQIVCFAWGIWTALFNSVSDCVTMGLNFDRWLAMAFPVFYNSQDKKYLVILNGICWLVPSAFWFSGFYMEAPQTLMSVCYGSSSPDKWFQNIYSRVRWVIVALNLFFYFFALIILIYRFQKTRSLPVSQRKLARESMEISMIKTIGVIIFLYFSLKMLGYALNVYAISLGGLPQLRMTAYTSIPVVMFSASHFPTYFIMAKSFRDAFVSNVWRKSQSSAVVPVQ